MASPRIEALSWGRVDVAGHGAMRDAKLWPGGARAWDWNETGTRHRPGIQVADVQELVDHGARHVVLSRGQWKRLATAEATLVWLQQVGVSVEVVPTDAAVAAYNCRADAGEPVGALIHSTC